MPFFNYFSALVFFGLPLLSGVGKASVMSDTSRSCNTPIPHKSGGRRPGAGRPPMNLCRFRVSCKQETRAKMLRFAKAHGIKAERPGILLDAIMASLDLPEPEYLRLARVARAAL